MKRKAPEPTTTAAEIRKRLKISERSCSRMFASGLKVLRRGAGGRNPVVKLWDLVEFLHEREERQEPSESEREQVEIRRQHARKLKRENEIAEGRLISREDVRGQLAVIGNAFRVEAEAIARTHGAAVAADVNRMIERAKADWTKLVLGGDGDGKQD